MTATSGDIFLSGIGLIVIVLLIVLAIVWLIVPFAIFGTKQRLDRQTQLLEAQTLAAREQIEILRRIEAMARIDEREAPIEPTPFEPEPIQNERTEPRIVPGRTSYGR